MSRVMPRARPRARNFGAVNGRGMATFYRREIQRGFKIWTITLAAPAIRALLFAGVFTLVVGDTGKVVLGMHIAPSGKVTKVGLRGPNPIVQGECGGCIRRAVKSIDYPSFDGPEMVAHYPIVFE